MPNELRKLFALDPDLAYLNHAGFGAVPLAVLDERNQWARYIEANPTQFYETEAHARSALWELALDLDITSTSLDIAWMPNVTFGLNLIARSMMDHLKLGDEVLLTEHEYGAQVTLWLWICKKTGATLRTVPVDRRDGEKRANQILNAVNERTKVLQMSHITADLALLLPVRDVCTALAGNDVTTIVDGAHAPGQIGLDPSSIGCSFYVGDLHKWYAAPRSSGFLYASRENQARLNPLVIGWAGTDPELDLHERTCRPGTFDVSAWLSVPKAIEFHRRHLAPEAPSARELLNITTTSLEKLGFEPASCTTDRDSLMMASFYLPDGRNPGAYRSWLYENGVVVGFTVDPESGESLIRVSVAWYTSDEEIDRLLGCLASIASY
ncbi:aminotransferase class V-fold PLP-dependent enzyme [Ferrimicrobium acidiphilum]|uniref:aminotransferase class V-fold PLP-dependent enzyme n=1 Tax=Ferrimicrobium acidiphilum TaxID=121039 RepID=UPI0023F0FB5E|nr:aminotransferase class V-fold PLP-dependent enzyme [Ferrimicrobium acidiphilum]